uniref:Uncharacterized protein n=1 Tax=Oryza sativa subsp. japonica TaxID=39947 RepID=Q652U3_ORYSJ|nr:hypothetical protein [Oryza sativa Japonica Group]BAD46174.1 hypothetical protein [Oryza sativa Japonica Group]
MDGEEGRGGGIVKENEKGISEEIEKDGSIRKAAPPSGGPDLAAPAPSRATSAAAAAGPASLARAAPLSTVAAAFRRTSPLLSGDKPAAVEDVVPITMGLERKELAAELKVHDGGGSGRRCGRGWRWLPRRLERGGSGAVASGGGDVGAGG